MNAHKAESSLLKEGRLTLRIVCDKSLIQLNFSYMASLTIQISEQFTKPSLKPAEEA